MMRRERKRANNDYGEDGSIRESDGVMQNMRYHSGSDNNTTNGEKSFYMKIVWINNLNE